MASEGTLSDSDIDAIESMILTPVEAQTTYVRKEEVYLNGVEDL